MSDSIFEKLLGPEKWAEHERRRTAEREKAQRLREQMEAVEAEGRYTARFNPNDPQMWCCRRCGSMVGDRTLHDQWCVAERQS